MSEFSGTFQLTREQWRNLEEASRRYRQEQAERAFRSLLGRVAFVSLLVVMGFVFGGPTLGFPAIMIGAAGFYITNAEAISMLTDYAVGINAGTAAVINIYDSTVPADADTALGAQVLLAQLTCSASVFSGIADDTPGALATFDTITADASANATGTASFFRILTQDAGTVVAQGTVATASADLILNTTSITSGSTVSITAATILLPEGP